MVRFILNMPRFGILRIWYTGRRGSIPPEDQTHRMIKRVTDPVELSAHQHPQWRSGDYINLREVGRGSFGKVETMRRKHTRAFVASKLYAPNDEGWRWDAIREIATLKLVVGHPSFVHVVGVFVSPDGPRLLMEGMQRNLKEHYRLGRKCPVRRHVCQLLSGLAYLNEVDIYHRDLKPQNILANDREDVKIADFGMAARFNASSRAQTLVTCTIWYRAPELWTRKAYTLNLDIWSLGCTIAEVVSDQPLFAFEENDMPLAHARFPDVTLRAIEEAKRVVPEVSSMLCVDPDRRPTAQELIRSMGEEVRVTRSRSRPTRPLPHGQDLWSHQQDITNASRVVLVDWMLLVCRAFRLTLDTLETSIWILDGILSRVVVRRVDFQLAGIVSMVIASKASSEPEGCPELRDFVYICDKAYDISRIVEYEDQVVALLDFEVMSFPLLPFVEGRKLLFRLVYMFSDRRGEFAPDDVEKAAEEVEGAGPGGGIREEIDLLLSLHARRECVMKWM